jgi:signal-transduction protein with cAMP-binding, CBS, and nucleotidyltransferase domain
LTIENHLVERKGLKQVERKELKEGFKVTHQIKSITWINQEIHFK